VSPRFSFVRGDIGDGPLLASVVPGHDVVVNTVRLIVEHRGEQVCPPFPVWTPRVVAWQTCSGGIAPFAVVNGRRGRHDGTSWDGPGYQTWVLVASGGSPKSRLAEAATHPAARRRSYGAKSRHSRSHDAIGLQAVGRQAPLTWKQRSRCEITKSCS